MVVRDLFVRELRYRPGGFLLGLVAVTAVAASIVGARGFLAGHDADTVALVVALEERAADRMAQMRDDARVFSKSLGFNILLLPEEQDSGALYAENRSTHFFTRAQVAALGRAKFATLNHLLPMLRHRVRWETYGGDVVLVGVEGEIYIKSPSFQKPIEARIEQGTAHVGDALAQRLALNPGDRFTLLGETFTVGRIQPQSASVDDITLLMNLADVQRLSGYADKVTGILALSCNCAAGDLDPIRQEVGRVLSGVQIVEFAVRARARQRARDAIAESTRAEMEDLKASRTALRAQVGHFATLLVSLVVTGAVVFLAVLTSLGVRERRVEMAMLRALGVGSGAVVGLVLARSALTGVAGGVLGCGVGWMAVRLMAGSAIVVTTGFMLTVVGAALLVALFASAWPAWRAARTDPALILNQE
ncbi:MAG: FtsX-like permease family protein [Verrucomicrobia bacterium]|jgi:putative ABC transport system permease protein|nr:FtsX-like permease family protein [Verrucomicrobiota bacterium]